jgi:uncharacterized protein YutE (UPF0331/DUF86 family)
MDRAVIDQKLESLRRCLGRIRSKLPFTPEQLETDFDLQDIVTLNLTRSVQLAVDMAAHIVSGLDLPAPTTMGESFDRLAQGHVIDSELAHQLKNAVGFRNVAIHNYNNVNWQIVHVIVQHHLYDFDAFAKAVLIQQEKNK